MKKMGFVLSFLTIATILGAQVSIKVDSFPPSLEEFIQLRDGLATSPEGGAVLGVLAMLEFTRNASGGMDFFTVILVNDGTMLQSSKQGYKGMEPTSNTQYLIKRLKDKPYIASSYLPGATPDNGYKEPDFPLTFEVTRNAASVQSDGSVKVFVKSNGADSARPVLMKKNSAGIWKIAEFSSLVVDVRKPARIEADNL